MRGRSVALLVACLLVVTAAYAESICDPNMTWWGLLWYRGRNEAFDVRWWYGMGWPALLGGLPVCLVTGLVMFGMSRAVRRICGKAQRDRRTER